MTLLARIEEANRHDLSDFLPFRIAGRRYGWVRPRFAARLERWPEVFRVSGAGLELAAALDRAHTPPRERTLAVAEVCATLARDGVIRGWRDELYPVTERWGATPVMLLERAAVPFFGITGYGVHMNGFVIQPTGELCMWVARRALDKPTGAGKLDQLVAGGQPHGIGLRANLVKECAEEAGIGAALAGRARAVGAVSYVLETDAGIRPDVLFNFDLELPPDFEPANTDGEVDSFQRLSIEQVEQIVARGREFKFNCALVVIDFLLRHGRIDADAPEYEAIVLGLRSRPRGTTPDAR